MDKRIPPCMEIGLLKLPWVIFVVLLGMCGAVGAAMILGEEPFEERQVEVAGSVSTERVYLGHGVPHPVFGTMQAGESGPARHTNIFWAGWAFAVLQVIFFLCCLQLGMRKYGRLGPARIALQLGGVGFFGIFTMLFLSYRTFMQSDEHALILSQVTPTAWMVYGVWIFPVVFVFIYYWYFDSWYLTNEDLERFRSIVKQQRAGKES